MGSLLSACGQLGGLNDDCECGFYTNSAGEMVHWADGQSIELKFNKKFPYSNRDYFVAATDEYNQIFEDTNLLINKNEETAPSVEDNDPGSVSGDGVNGIYWLTGEWPWLDTNPNSDAMTVVKSNGTSLTEADIFFRAESFSRIDASIRVQLSSPLSASLETFRSPLSRFAESFANSLANPFSKLTGLAASAANLPSTANTDEKFVYIIGLHELGHLLGRVHSKHGESIMKSTVGLSLMHDPVSQYDIQTFEQVYKIKN